MDGLIQSFEEKLTVLKLKKIEVIFQKLQPDAKGVLNLLEMDRRLAKWFIREEGDTLRRFFQTYARQTGKVTISKKFFYLNMMAAAQQERFGVTQMLFDKDIEEIYQSLSLMKKKNCPLGETIAVLGNCNSMRRSFPKIHVEEQRMKVEEESEKYKENARIMGQFKQELIELEGTLTRIEHSSPESFLKKQSFSYTEQTPSVTQEKEEVFRSQTKDCRGKGRVLEERAKNVSRQIIQGLKSNNQERQRETNVKILDRMIAKMSSDSQDKLPAMKVVRSFSANNFGEKLSRRGRSCSSSNANRGSDGEVSQLPPGIYHRQLSATKSYQQQHNQQVSHEVNAKIEKRKENYNQSMQQSSLWAPRQQAKRQKSLDGTGRVILNSSIHNSSHAQKCIGYLDKFALKQLHLQQQTRVKGNVARQSFSSHRDQSTILKHPLSQDQQQHPQQHQRPHSHNNSSLQSVDNRIMNVSLQQCMAGQNSFSEEMKNIGAGKELCECSACGGAFSSQIIFSDIPTQIFSVQLENLRKIQVEKQKLHDEEQLMIYELQQQARLQLQSNRCCKTKPAIITNQHLAGQQINDFRPTSSSSASIDSGLKYTTTAALKYDYCEDIREQRKGRGGGEQMQLVTEWTEEQRNELSFLTASNQNIHNTTLSLSFTDS